MVGTGDLQRISLPACHESTRVHLIFYLEGYLRAVVLRDGESMVVGRLSPADLVLDHPTLSRAHARLSLHGGRVILEDLDSKNGCALNGSRVRIAVLGEGDVANLAAVTLTLAGGCRPAQEPKRLSHAAFVRAVADERARAQLFGRSVSVVAAKHGQDEGTVEEILRCLGQLDRICSFAPTLSFVLMAEQDQLAAGALCDRLSSALKSELRFGVAVYSPGDDDSGDLLSDALEACRLAKAGKPGVIAAPACPAQVNLPPIIRSPCMIRLYGLVARAARTTMPALVLGETGTGKELVARALHDRSPRSQAPFRALNCASIPSNLIESILFGHERGAFTGADRTGRGIFELAHGGTLFLDEVGELSSSAQAALLRVLESKRVMRIGGAVELPVDVRVVAATHRNLPAMLIGGTFREDLLFRLDALTLSVPPLRERTEEILPLAERFLTQARQHWHTSARRFAPAASEALLGYAWPGNVRQLRNVIERASVVCEGDAIEPRDISPHVFVQPERGETMEFPVELNGASSSFPDRIREFECLLIRKALEKAQGNQAQAARILGLPRRTLANKVHAYDLLS